MKICFLAAANSVHSYNWIKFFVDKGHEIHWITLKPSLFDLDPSIKLIEAKNILHGIRLVKKVVKENNIDLVHAHYAGAYGLIGSFVKKTPVVLTAWGVEKMRISFHFCLLN